MNDAAIIEGTGLRRVFGRGKDARAAVDGVDVAVRRGEFLSVFGPSGSGKSTLLGILGGLDRGFEGELRIDGRSVHAMSDRALSRLRGQKLGFVFQAFHLLDHLSVLDNVLIPSMFTTRESPEHSAKRALERVGLDDRANDAAGSLSGGQRQRVAIARAIAHGPSLLLCDEPTGNLDTATAAQIIDIFASLNRSDGTTVLCATHDERIAAVATRTVALREGRLGERADANA